MTTLKNAANVTNGTGAGSVAVARRQRTAKAAQDDANQDAQLQATIQRESDRGEQIYQTYITIEVPGTRYSLTTAQVGISQKVDSAMRDARKAKTQNWIDLYPAVGEARNVLTGAKQWLQRNYLQKANDRVWFVRGSQKDEYLEEYFKRMDAVRNDLLTTLLDGLDAAKDASDREVRAILTAAKVSQEKIDRICAEIARDFHTPQSIEEGFRVILQPPTLLENENEPGISDLERKVRAANKNILATDTRQSILAEIDSLQEDFEKFIAGDTRQWEMDFQHKLAKYKELQDRADFYAGILGYKQDQIKETLTRMEQAVRAKKGEVFKVVAKPTEPDADADADAQPQPQETPVPVAEVEPPTTTQPQTTTTRKPRSRKPAIATASPVNMDIAPDF